MICRVVLLVLLEGRLVFLGVMGFRMGINSINVLFFYVFMYKFFDEFSVLLFFGVILEVRMVKGNVVIC